MRALGWIILIETVLDVALAALDAHEARKRKRMTDQIKARLEQAFLGKQ